MGTATIVFHILLFTCCCCITLTYQASLDTQSQSQREDQRALDVRREEKLTRSPEVDEEEDREKRGSGCGFSCPAGEKMVQNETSIPRANGCGPYGIKLSFVDDAAEDCCKAHDFCYEICGKARLDCDVMLRDCIKDLRRKRDTSRVKRGWHSMMASIFYRTVRTFGCKAYVRGQKRGCMCVQDEFYPSNRILDNTLRPETEQEGGNGFQFNILTGFN